MRTFLLVMMLSGCGVNVVTTPLNPAPHAMSPGDAATLPVLSTGAPLRPHVDVALISARMDDLARHRDTQHAMVSAIRARAAALGCDALVVLNALGRNEIEGLVGTCIAYLDHDGPPGLADDATTPKRASGRASLIEY